jgi:hypothetical protein
MPTTPPLGNAARITLGGTLATTIYSGTPAANDTMVQSGAGRLDALHPHMSQSGVATVIYDGAVATSGGPFAASGHKVLAVIPANFHTPFLNTFPAIVPVGAPFYSGLIIAQKSGQIGVTLSYTPLT